MLLLSLKSYSQNENPFGDIDFFEDLDKPAKKLKEFVLDTDKSLFGIPPYSLKKDIIKKFGEPVTRLFLNKEMETLVYGDQICFVLSKNKLKTVYIEFTHGVLKPALSALRKEGKTLENTSWEFANGINSSSRLSDIRTILKKNYKFQNNYYGEWDKKNCKVSFEFYGFDLGSFSSDEDDKSMEYHLSSLKIDYHPIKNENKPIVFNKKPKPEILLEIEPDKHFLGMLIGTSKEKLVKEFGPPAGLCELKNGGQALIYGNKTAFFFKKDKLYGIHIDHDSVVADSLKFDMKDHAVFDKYKWKLSNGLKKESSLEDVKKKFGKKFKSAGKWQGNFETEKSLGRIHFYRTSIDGIDGDADRNYKLSSITVMAK